ncbi:hypothetical protein ACFWJC_17870, partial [Bacillus wiedmannii]|uniref:hypothetical protein n=1 Tax=Bacillus wiedmannii TaxID=1890302 RepID=UPI00366393DD
HPSIVWANSIKYNSARNICAIFSFILSLHQNQKYAVLVFEGFNMLQSELIHIQNEKASFIS